VAQSDNENHFILTDNCKTWQNYKFDWCSLQ